MFCVVDEDDGDYSAGDLSLREALALAEAGSTIAFDKSVFSGGPLSTINLTLGQLTIDKAITINGDTNRDGIADVTIDGSGNGGGEFSILLPTPPAWRLRA